MTQTTDSSNSLAAFFQAKATNLINGNDFECEINSVAETWFQNLLGGLSPSELHDFQYLSEKLSVQIWIANAVVIFGVSAPPFRSFQEGKKDLKDMDQMSAFWNIDSASNFQLQGLSMHMLKDKQLMVDTLAFSGIPRDLAQDMVDEANAIMEASPKIGYDFPLWSLEAFAYPAIGGIPNDRYVIFFFLIIPFHRVK